MKVLLGITGSVASTLAKKLVEELLLKHEVKVIATQHALYFCGSTGFFPVQVLHDKDEWAEGPRSEGYQRGDPVLHIELRKWADILMIAPLSANTLAKMANGLADNLLTSVLRAWDPQKPIVIAPAMNTMMWEHLATADHLTKILRYYPKLTIIPPIKKILACGDEGTGAMASIEDIVKTTE